MSIKLNKIKRTLTDKKGRGREKEREWNTLKVIKGNTKINFAIHELLLFHGTFSKLKSHFCQILTEH